MNWKNLTVLAAALIVSLGILAYPPAKQIAGELAALPLIGTVFSGLFLILREQTAHERALLLQQLNTAASLGTASHMANVAFDKHVAFSEESLNAALDIIAKVTSKGPSAEAAGLALQLTSIRRKHALWVTTDVNTSLEKFEHSVWRIGALSQQLPSLEFDHELYRNRQEQVQAAFFELLGISDGDDESKREQAIDKIIRNLQDLLGNPELTKLRASLVRTAAQTLNNPR